MEKGMLAAMEICSTSKELYAVVVDGCFIITPRGKNSRAKPLVYTRESSAKAMCTNLKKIERFSGASVISLSARIFKYPGRM